MSDRIEHLENKMKALRLMLSACECLVSVENYRRKRPDIGAEQAKAAQSKIIEAKKLLEPGAGLYVEAGFIRDDADADLVWFGKHYPKKEEE